MEKLTNKGKKMKFVTFITILLISFLTTGCFKHKNYPVESQLTPGIVNPDTGKLVPSTPCAPVSNTDSQKHHATEKKPCEIYTRKFIQQEHVTYTISKATGSTTCCMTTYDGGEVSESCFTTSRNLQSCPGPYVKQ